MVRERILKRKWKERRLQQDGDRGGGVEELNVLLFSQSSSSDVLNFHNFSKSGVFQYAAFIMKTS